MLESVDTVAVAAAPRRAGRTYWQAQAIAEIALHHFTVATEQADRAAQRRAFYVLAGYEQLGYRNDLEATKGLIEDFGIIALPGSTFQPSGKNTGMLRFCFAVEDDVLETACDRLATASARVS